jgi:acylphosphatase
MLVCALDKFVFLRFDGMERRTYHFSGHVQGVGFRYTTHNIALRHNVYGYVRNLPDGRVELVMEGDEREMEGVVQNLRQRMSEYVRNIEAHAAPATGEFERFSIKHC